MENFFHFLNNLLKPFSFYRTQDPLTEELEQVVHFEHNMSLMIKARWVFCGLCTVYGIITGLICLHSKTPCEVGHLTLPLLMLFFFMLAYNSWYHYSYRWFVHLYGLCQIQMLVDVIFCTVMIHYTGGIVSWVWVVYPLLIMESALLFDKPRDTWLIAISSIVFYGLLLMLEFNGIVRQIQMPFYIYTAGYGQRLGWIYFSWVTFTVICSALISTYLIRLQRNSQAKLQSRIIRDNLTNLYNRKHFFYTLQSEIQRAKRFEHIVSILLLDVDGFKVFNDTFGHQEGDKLLQVIANILKENVNSQAYDVDMPFRYGGDEFAIILPESTPSSVVIRAEHIRSKIALKGVLQLAEQIRSQVQNTPHAKNIITTSIGIATFPLHGNSVEKVMQAADNALYAAKNSGRNKVVLSEESNPNVKV